MSIGGYWDDPARARGDDDASYAQAAEKVTLELCPAASRSCRRRNGAGCRMRLWRHRGIAQRAVREPAIDRFEHRRAAIGAGSTAGAAAARQHGGVSPGRRLRAAVCGRELRSRAGRGMHLPFSEPRCVLQRGVPRAQARRHADAVGLHSGAIVSAGDVGADVRAVRAIQFLQPTAMSIPSNAIVIWRLRTRLRFGHRTQRVSRNILPTYDYLQRIGTQIVTSGWWSRLSGLLIGIQEADGLDRDAELRPAVVPEAMIRPRVGQRARPVMRRRGPSRSRCSAASDSLDEHSGCVVIPPGGTEYLVVNRNTMTARRPDSRHPRSSCDLVSKRHLVSKGRLPCCFAGSLRFSAATAMSLSAGPRWSLEPWRTPGGDN